MDRINGMSRTDALAAFKACCGSTKYAEVTSASSASARVRSGLPGRVGTAPLHASLPAKLKGTCWALAQGRVAAMQFGSAEELKRKSDSVWSACGRQVSVNRLSFVSAERRGLRCSACMHTVE